MIEIRNISKTYDNGSKALKDIDIRIQDGEFVFIMGRSGSGKSTLIRLLLKEAEPSSGRIIVNDMDLQKMPRRYIPKYRRRLGVVFQDFRLLKDRTVFENVAFAQRVVGASPRKIREEVPRMLKLVGLSSKYKSFPHQLSGGMLQRIMIGIAMSMEPSLLIADEPTTAIDAITQFDILNEFAVIKQKHKTAMIFISHDLNAVSQIADKIVVLNQGTVVDQGDFHHIIHHAADPYTRLLIEKRTDVMRKYRQALEGGECSHAQAG